MEKDRLLNPKNNPETKAEHPPKKQPSSSTIKALGKAAVKGSQSGK